MNKRVISYIVLLCLGAGLIIAGGMELVDNYWSGFGGGIVGVAAVRLILMYRYSRNEEYRKSVEINNKDERNKFIANKAWAWAGYFYVMIAAIGSIVFKLLGREELTMFCASSACFIMVLYWLSWLRLKKKY